MNHERDTLGRQLDELRQKTAEASQYSYDQELAVTRSMDRFEQLVSDYTALGHSIGTIPPVTEGPAGMGPGDVDFTVDLDLGVEDMGEVQVAGQRLRGTIWPALIRYGDGFRRELEEVENGNIQLDDEVDRLGQKVERQKEEAANLEIKLRVVQDQAEEAKAVSRCCGAGESLRTAIDSRRLSAYWEGEGGGRHLSAGPDESGNRQGNGGDVETGGHFNGMCDAPHMTPFRRPSSIAIARATTQMLNSPLFSACKATRPRRTARFPSSSTRWRRSR